MFVLDADAHVEESPATFADAYLEPAYRDRRPQVVALGERGVWVIDDRIFPKRIGKGTHTFATPAAVDGRRTPLTASKPDELASITLEDVDARLRQMAAEHIDRQVIYPTLFLAYPLTDDPAFANALCRAYNSWIAEICNQRPDKLRWVCTVNLDDVPAAMAEVRRCRRDLNAIGVFILGTAGDRKLDDPALDPFYATLCDLDMPLAVHVGWSSPSLNHIYDNVYDALVLSFTFSLFTGFVDIVAGGVLDRHPSLRVAFLEAGCQWVPFLLDRMEHYREMAVVRKRWNYDAREAPHVYLERGNVYLACEVEDQLLPYCIERFGAERFLFASDIPHGDREYDAVNVLLKRTDISEEAKQLILGENARRFYGW
ncbi:MAG TPA: amidohydrolase family protein [Chloroflexota bacterium]|nr:amidohydrolase family protein [Chloroflexota bacterium]